MDKVRDKVRDPSSRCFAGAGEVCSAESEFQKFNNEYITDRTEKGSSLFPGNLVSNLVCLLSLE